MGESIQLAPVPTRSAKTGHVTGNSDVSSKKSEQSSIKPNGVASSSEERTKKPDNVTKHSEETSEQTDNATNISEKRANGTNDVSNGADKVSKEVSEPSENVGELLTEPDGTANTPDRSSACTNETLDNSSDSEPASIDSHF